MANGTDVHMTLKVWGRRIPPPRPPTPNDLIGDEILGVGGSQVGFGCGSFNATPM